MTKEPKSTLINEEGIKRTLRRLAHEILENVENLDTLRIVGIRDRGDHLAKRLAETIQAVENVDIPIGFLDITFYRDDFRTKLSQPSVMSTEIPFDLEEVDLILVDDVLYTGRTIRAAMDAIMDYGRPASIKLAVLVDRGHRELPIRPDYAGKNIPTAKAEQVRVHLQEIDGEDGVYLYEKEDEEV
ncbi:MAG: Bifunctional protein PyrR [Candidatus Marinimicrobia bacterium]|nr:Bifunctional protein PyrR [Candidatus Neomarinimicrobiota bacterium]